MEDEDREEIARLIIEGFTSGRLDPEERQSIVWDLSYSLLDLGWNDNDRGEV